MSDFKPSPHELIARGVCILDRQVLLCRHLGASRTFLPGGHIEAGEDAVVALHREFGEELGREIHIVAFLGAVEHAFTTGGTAVGEVNLMFAVEVPGLAPPHPPLGVEGHLEFLWQPVDRLDEAGFEPAVFRRLLPQWAQAPQTAASRYASSLATSIFPMQGIFM